MKNIKKIILLSALLIVAASMSGLKTSAADKTGTVTNTSTSKSGSQPTESSYPNTKTTPTTTVTTKSGAASGSTGTSGSGASQTGSGSSASAGTPAVTDGKLSQEERTARCQAHEQRIETILRNFQTRATQHQAQIDQIFSQTLDYQQRNDINSEDITRLIGVVQAQKATAAHSVGVLNALSTDIDCSSNTVGSYISAFGRTSKQTSTDLSHYRYAVSQLIRALEEAN
jgi:hypothetical protein